VTRSELRSVTSRGDRHDRHPDRALVNRGQDCLEERLVTGQEFAASVQRDPAGRRPACHKLRMIARRAEADTRNHRAVGRIARTAAPAGHPPPIASADESDGR
jgi:hypothetical protein